MDVTVALVCVVSGETYERYAAAMFVSALEHFGPDPFVAHIALPGREGWPAATLYRYHVLLEHRRTVECFDHLFLVDADMRFEAPVGVEVLGSLVATLHPGYVGKTARLLPFERDKASAAHATGRAYFCGGFVGGETDEMLGLAESIRRGVDRDEEKGIMATWHDESHLNAVLAIRPPCVVLSPAYCYPDNDSGYRTWWPEQYERKLVAVDKTRAERGSR